MGTAIFLRVLEPKPEEKGSVLADAVQSVREGHLDGRSTFKVDPSSFREVPGAPFAYWVSDGLRRKFRELPRFESEGRTVKQGLATADDFRFVRAWWEVDPWRLLHVPVKAEELGDQGRLRDYQEACREQTRHGKRWVPFAKGGAYAPYYADVYLVVDWENDGERIRNFYGPNGRLASRPQNTDYYFRPGLTWPLRTSRFSPQALPAGVITSVRGYGIFSDPRTLPVLLGLGAASIFDYLFKIMLGRFGHPEFIVGVLQQLPTPNLDSARQSLSMSATTAALAKRALLGPNEINHCFAMLAAFTEARSGLHAASMEWGRYAQAQNNIIQDAQRSLDETVNKAYGLTMRDMELLDLARDEGSARSQVASDEAYTAPLDSAGDSDLEDDEADSESEDVEGAVGGHSVTTDVLSFCIGSSFGRWDVRMATDPTLSPELPGPFDPLPPCTPAMLVGPDGLPARSDSIVSETWLRARRRVGTLPPASLQPAKVPDEAYPLRISWSGILVDDEDHPDDIVGRSREALATLFGEQSPAIESEAVQLLGRKDLREYFRNPRGFWADHLRRYSKKPRKAPIYWLLQSKKHHYAVWLYYPRLDGDLLFKVLQFYVEPKIRREEQKLADLHAQIGGSDGARARRQAERAVEQQEALLADIREFRERLARVAELHLVPNMDDGVVLNAAPLHELMPWPEPARYWRDLLQGKYDWSDIAGQIRERQGQGVKLA